MSWIHINFLRGSGASHLGTATFSCLCALVAPSESIETWVWPSNQNSSGRVRPAYSGEFSAHHDTRAKSFRSCIMVAVLFVPEYICKHLSAESRWRLFKLDTGVVRGRMARGHIRVPSHSSGPQWSSQKFQSHRNASTAAANWKSSINISSFS